MHICGIVAEYNPFHNGHAHHIAETRRILGGDTAIVTVMSGNYVQRGEAALLDKHLRASMAVAAGTDLVLELPAVHALRSAEGFAYGAVERLAALGVLTHLSFGAECDDVGTLSSIASLLLEHETVSETLHQLKTGISYAAARERALYGRIQDQAAVIGQPNNILAVEYLKALTRLGSGITPLAIRRSGAGHDSEGAAGGMASASHIRGLVRQGALREALPLVPAESRSMLEEAVQSRRALTDFTLLEAQMASAFARLTVDDLAALPDIAEGLEHRLYSAIRGSRGFDRISEAARTRRYPLARIRRLLYCAFLGITREEAERPPEYLRVLAFNDTGRRVLARARKAAALPLVTKPAHVKKLGEAPQQAFEREALATDLYHIAQGSPEPPGSDWRATIHIFS